MDVCIKSFCWFKPMDDPPAGLTPLLMHGTPITGVGSSGGVTYNNKTNLTNTVVRLSDSLTSKPMLPLSENLMGFE